MSKNDLLKDFYKFASIDVQGLENIPKSGTNIYLSNHLCMNDIFMLKYILKDAVNIVSSNSLFKEGERKELYHKLLTPFPLEVRAEKKYKEVCLDKITDLLVNKINIIIFPEGVFSDNNELYRAKTGVIRVLFKAKEKNNDINIVPICIDIKDLDEEKKQRSTPWDGFTAKVKILKPFDYEAYYKSYKNSNESIIRTLIDDIMNLIAKEKDAVYRNEYGKLYDLDGFFFPNGEFISFKDSKDNKYYNNYKEQINSLYESIINSKDI